MEEIKEIFILDCMKENLVHARHVENERMMFNSLFAALVGGTLAFISQVDNKLIITVMIGILMIINILCYIFTKRWNKVFKNHYALAQKIYMMFLNQGETGVSENANPANRSSNRFYYFSNQQNRKPHSIYISTRQYFIIYNILMFVLLICSLFYFLTAGPGI